MGKKRNDTVHHHKVQGNSLTQNKNQIIWFFVALAGATLVAYISSFKHNFVYYDDHIYVFENNVVLNPTTENLKRLLRLIVSNNYHPLTMLSLAANIILFGKGVASFIITNVVFHIFNTLLVFEFLRRLTKGDIFVPFFTALIFGIHPMHVESVAWISERKDVLYGFFFLLSCISYINFKESKKYIWIILSLLMFILSCLSKAMAVTLPLVLMLIDYWYEGTIFSWKKILNKIPFFAIALLFGIISLNVQAGKDFYGIFDNKDAISAVSSTLKTFDKFSFGTYGFMKYHIMAFVPYGQSSLHSYSGIPFPPKPVYFFTILLFLGYIAVFIWSYKKNKYLFFGMGFFLVTIILVLQFISVGKAYMAERYSYLPYIGLFFMVFHFLHQFIKEKTYRTSGIAFGLICFFLTVNRQKVWADNLDLWNDVYKKYPNEGAVFEGLAADFGRREMYEEARKFANKAKENNIESYYTYVVLANISAIDSMKTGNNIQPSLELYQKALTMKSTDGNVYLNRGVTFSKAGRHAEAVPDFTKALELGTSQTPVRVRGYRAFGNLMSQQYTEALADYNFVIENTPDQPDKKMFNDRAVAKYNLGDLNGAITDLERAVQLDPNFVDARNNLNQLLSLRK
ncbi:MAG: tetratricopeptide repeat protein [Chitinophagaceae bacterium]